jgi:DNA-directed RNA polymerase subunit omega
MARITVEDCLEVVPNRFSLVLVAAERSKQLMKGATTMLAGDNENKEVVTSLREIAAGYFRIDETEVLAHDEWKPVHRQRKLKVDEELPPEA